MRVVAIGAAAAVAIGAAFEVGPFAADATDQPRPGRPQGAEATVSTRTVVLRPERTRIEAVGTAEAIRSVTLHPVASGEVISVGFEPNMRVERGQVILQLDQRRERLAVDLAATRVADAQRRLDRYERTVDSGAVPKSTVDEARTALELARLEQAQAEVALDDRTVLAPFSGHVGAADVETGDRIGPADTITTLDDRSALLVDFPVPETLITRLAPGDTVSVAPWSDRDVPMAGEIVELGSRVDPETRSFRVRARIENRDDLLRPGMSFAVVIDLVTDRYPAVPEIAVQWGADGAHVWAVREGAAALVPVRIVQRQEGMVLVDADLDAGEPVVVRGIQQVREGRPVTVGGGADQAAGGT